MNQKLNKYIFVSILVILIEAIKVDPESSLFVDQYGRYTIYHGVNVVRKLAPFHPITDKFDANYSLADIDLTNLKNWGFNIIRLHVAWEGVQPVRDQYNDTYIEILRDIIRKCAKFDIKVLLDAHQDLFNRQFCGNGFPDWVAKKDTFPSPILKDLQYDQNGYPNRKRCLQVHFSMFYLSTDLNKFQQRFFTNQDGLLDQFAKFWKRIASFMKDQPNLLGYQLLNEPMGQDFSKNPFDFLNPRVSNNKYLYPAYTKIYNAIREQDPDKLIFYETSVLDMFGLSFQKHIGDQSERQKQVFSYHTYCPMVSKQGEPVIFFMCQMFNKIQIASQQKAVKKLKVGGFLSQFGALSNSKKSGWEVTVITRQAAKNFRSWAYWQFKYLDDITTAAKPGTTQSFYFEDGSLQQNKIKSLARSYAYAICGTPVDQSFQDGLYILKWKANSNCDGKNTQIFLSIKYYYPNGFSSGFKNCQDCKLQQINKNGYYQVITKSKGKKVVQLYVKPTN